MYLKFSGILVLNEIIEMSRAICQRIHSIEIVSQKVTKIWTCNLRRSVTSHFNFFQNPLLIPRSIP